MTEDWPTVDKTTVFDLYAQATYVRDEAAVGVPRWTWLKDENGAWAGPRDEFPDLRHKMLAHARGRHLIIQAGGCLGMYPKLWARDFDYVYTFEPDPLNFFVLVQNCQQDNIYKFNAALGDSHVPVRIERSGMENVGMHRVFPEGAVPQLMIDDLDPPYLDAIQLDVESSELRVLLGARRLIEKFKPVIATENGNEDIAKFLNQWDYKPVERNSADTIWAIPPC